MTTGGSATLAASRACSLPTTSSLIKLGKVLLRKETKACHLAVQALLDVA
jgi:hypothetical protein